MWQDCSPSVLTTVPWIIEAFAALVTMEPAIAEALGHLDYILVGGASLSANSVVTLAVSAS